MAAGMSDCNVFASLPISLLPCRGIDHHWQRDTFATAGQQVDVWDHSRSQPVHSFSWGADSLTSVRFNPVSLSCGACPGLPAHQRMLRPGQVPVLLAWVLP